MHRILYHIDTPHPGGATNQLLTLASHLDRSVFEPIITCGTYGPLDEWVAVAEAAGIHVIRIPTRSTRDARATALVEKVIADVRPSIAHMHLAHSGSCRQGILACARARIPLAATEHDPFPLTFAKKMVKRSTLLATDRTVALSHGSLNFLKSEYKLGNDQVCLIHNGIDASDHENVTPIDNRRLEIPDDHLVVTTIAELHERKGVRYLLAAVPEIVREFPRVTFVIVGDGETREFLHGMKTPNTVFIRSLPHVAAVLAVSDLYILPSIREAFGLTILEAFASKVPVIATATDGPSDIITNGTNGILVPPRDPRALAREALRLLRSKETRYSLADAAYRTLTEHFTADRMARETERVYKELLDTI